MGKLLFSRDELKMLPSKIILFPMNKKCYHQNYNFIPDEQKMLPTIVRMNKNVTIQTNFTPDEPKMLTSELVLFRMNKKFLNED